MILKYIRNTVTDSATMLPFNSGMYGLAGFELEKFGK
jgi:hypothetical protein